MNLAIVIPWDFYAIRHSEGWSFGGDFSSMEADLDAACVEHVLAVAPKQGAARWLRLRDRLREAAVNVDEVPFALWHGYLLEKEFDSNSFPSIDLEHEALAEALVAFGRERGAF